MSDILLESALVYEKLMDIKYHITIARKQKLEHLIISFPQESYHHLAGFQYVGISQLRNRKSALKMILNQIVTESHIKSAGTFECIAGRLKSIALLPELLENGRLVFRLFVKCWGVKRKITKLSCGSGRSSDNQRKPV